MKRILSLLFSTRLMAILFIVFVTAMVIATFIENDYGTQTARAEIYNSWWFEGILILFVLNFIGNIKRYQLAKKRKLNILLLHVSFILIIIGAAITRYISYEGIMPIKEGETTNTFLSQDIYLNLIIDNGEIQKHPYEKKILLSAKGNPNYQLKTSFKGQPVYLKLIEYIPNVEENFVKDKKGETYLHIVESSSGNREDHYIKKGSLKEIYGVNIGFESNNSEVTAIEFTHTDNQLAIKSAHQGTFLRMSDRTQGIIKKDSTSSFELLALHNIAGLNFVIPEPPIKGFYKRRNGDPEENTEDLLVFKVSTPEGTKKVEITGGSFKINPATLFSIGKLNFRLNYGAKQLKLPFSIRLDKFILETYPGSQSPMSFESQIRVFPLDDKPFDYRIYMNHILNYKGYKFFQSSYWITDTYRESRLSVNYDFWGTTITYLGYMLLYTCLIIIAFDKNNRIAFLNKQLNKLRAKKKLLTLITLVFTSFLSYSQNNSSKRPSYIAQSKVDSILLNGKVSREHALLFSKLTIQDTQGRMKPVNTFASEMLRKVYKKDHYRDMDANQVFLSILKEPVIWFNIPIIYLAKEPNEIAKILGLPKKTKYASFMDFFDKSANYKLAEYQQRAFQKKIKNTFDKDIISLDQRVQILHSAITGSVLRLFPIPQDPNSTWVTHNELELVSFKGIDSVYVKQILPAYAQFLAQAIETNNYKEADQIIQGIHSFQRKYGLTEKPSESKVELEILYNQYDIFKKLFSYYMYISVLFFIIIIWQIFQDKKWLKYTLKIGNLILWSLFALHSLGLAIRWYISGHAPWSNAYESMIYVAWACMLFGLYFGKKSRITSAATAFVSGIILMIAHWNWLDPEIGNLVPVLNSYWLMIHVAIIVASYGPFILGAILGLITLFLIICTTNNNKLKMFDKVKELTIINELSLTAGLIMLTIGNFLGAMWANESWGRYWGWDPKETWALISIMIYAFILHMRLVPGLKSRWCFNVASLIGFASIMMTYFGVNFYLSGLHSYAKGDQVITPLFVYYSVVIASLVSLFAYFNYRRHYKVENK